jgi:hypothetical protein
VSSNLAGSAILLHAATAFHIVVLGEAGHSPAMPISWKISHDERLVTVKSDGTLRYGDIKAYFTGMCEEGVLPYRKLFDARAGHTDLNDDEVGSYANDVFAVKRLGVSLGPYAIVVGDDQGEAHAPILRLLLLTRQREVRVFSDLDEARDWVRVQPLPPPPP